MTLAADLHAAADHLQPHQAELRARLRTHADTIERVEREMRDGALVVRGHTFRADQMRQWANALKGGE